MVLACGLDLWSVFFWSGFVVWGCGLSLLSGFVVWPCSLGLWSRFVVWVCGLFLWSGFVLAAALAPDLVTYTALI